MRFSLFKSFKILLVLAIALAISVPVYPGIEVNDTESHFNEFSEFTVAHHDNIDDTYESHSHVHKHSEDGEEHEHDHEHSKGFQASSKIMYNSACLELNFLESKSTLGLSEENLISDPHAFGIFRPPIV